jgi:DNA-binding transcriptional MerR regulator
MTMNDQQLVQSSFFDSELFANLSYHTSQKPETIMAVAADTSRAMETIEASVSETPVQSMEDQSTRTPEVLLVSELSLKQVEFDFKEDIDKIEDIEKTEIVLDSQMSLPAALCDEALILEINSIPNKMGFKIGEVAEMLGIKQYILRYWESEFDVLKPKKAANNQRYYTKKDVENAYLIRKLLHRDRFSIEGAKGAMKELKSFVKTEVKKEKAISSVILSMTQTLQSVDEQAIDLLNQIRKMKSTFSKVQRG